MAEAFVRTSKRNYVGIVEKPNARAVMSKLHSCFHHYSPLNSHRALGDLTRLEHIAQSTSEGLLEIRGNKIGPN